MTRHPFRLAAAFASAAAFLAAPASAQDTADAPIEQGGDTVTIGLGAAYVPSYEGSDSHRIVPGAIVRGRVSGFSFFTRGLQLYVDAIPEAAGSDVDFSVGPVVGLRLARTSKNMKDDRVEALGQLETGYEVGAFVGIAKQGVLTSDYDNLSMRVSYLKDVGDAHQSHIITPSIEYGTPLSRSMFVGVGASAEFVGDGYASYYFDVSPTGAAASGLPTFSAEGGFKSWSVNSVLGVSLGGDLRHGLSLFAVGSYTRLQNDFRHSPIVSIAGSPNQWVGAIGLAYTF